MKKIFTIVSMLAMVAVVACNDELAIEKVPGDASVKPATISLSIPKGGLTKVSLTQDANPDGSVKLAWESTDAITVKNAADESKSVAFTYVSGAGTSNAVFSTADVSALDGATSYNIYLTSNLPGGYNSQTQASNESTAHLGYAASLKGVNKYDGASFSSAWAGAVENGSGTFESSSVLRIRAQMPTAAIADAVQKVIVKASEEIFGGEKELTVSITTPGVGGDGKVITVYATLPAGDVVIPANTELLFQFQVSANNYDKYTHYRKVTSSATLSSGQVNSFKIDCPNIASYANSSTESIGTAANPYLIGDKYQLSSMRGLMPIDATTYFKLVDDIDLNSEDWEPLNYNDSYKRGLYLDGQNHTIFNLTAYGTNAATGHTGYAYPSFSGVLNGTIKNVTFDGAIITAGGAKGGVVGGYIGTNSYSGTCENVTVKDATVTGTTNIGTFAGQINHSSNSFTNCHVTGTTTVTQNNATANTERSTGGFIGHGGKGATFNNCSVHATVQQGEGKTINAIGGFIGKADGGVSSFTDCHVLAGSSVSGNKNIGGFVGDNEAESSYEGCTSAASVEGSNDNTGGFVGYFKQGSLTTCSSSGTVIGHTCYTGGLIGTMAAGDVCNSCAIGNVALNNNDVEYAQAGGFIGSMNGGTLTRCYATGDVTVNTGKKCGGFIGVLSGSSNITISESYATGNYSPGAEACGGFIGMIEGDSICDYSIYDCYATGNVKNNKYQCGGFVGLISKSAGTVLFDSCFASGTNWAGYGYGHGGFAGRIETTIVTIQKCAAWNSQVKGQTAINKWSAGAIVGVAHPLCTLTDNYRKPGMTLHAYWGTSGKTVELTDTYQHANVSSSSPLVTFQSDGTTLAQTTKTGLSTSDGVAIFAYQGKCVAGQTLSQLASSTSYLNWGTEKWDYTQDMPRLKWTLGE